MAKTNSSFKMPKQVKQLLSSVYSMKNRSTVKRLFIDALVTYERNKNRKFSDPATGQKPNKKETAGE